MSLRIEIPQEEIVRFCLRHGIRRLALFGSVLGDDFTPESDVDLLVEFKPGGNVSASASFPWNRSCRNFLDERST